MRKSEEQRLREKFDHLRSKEMRQLVETMGYSGDAFGNAIIEMMKLKRVEPVTMGILTIGLAKACAMLFDVGRRTGLDVSSLFKKEKAFYSKEYEKLESKHKEEV